MEGEPLRLLGPGMHPVALPRRGPSAVRLRRSTGVAVGHLESGGAGLGLEDDVTHVPEDSTNQLAHGLARSAERRRPLHRCRWRSASPRTEPLSDPPGGPTAGDGAPREALSRLREPREPANAVEGGFVAGSVGAEDLQPNGSRCPQGLRDPRWKGHFSPGRIVASNQQAQIRLLRVSTPQLQKADSRSGSGAIW